MIKTQVTWTGPGLRLIGEVEGSPAIVLDSKNPTYGANTGISPKSLLLVGLAGCTAMDVISIMAKKRQPLVNLQVKVTAEETTRHPKVYQNIHLEYIAYGTGISEQALQRAIQLSETTYCGASAMLRHATEITHSYRIVEAPYPAPPGEMPK